MSWPRVWAIRLAGLYRKSRSERDMQEEFDSHIAMHIADNVRAGMTPEAARRKALLSLGSVEASKEAYRERRTVPFVEHLFLDLHFAIRQFRKAPGFAGSAISILAVSMAASIALFTFVDAALIKPLPYPEPHRLVDVTESTREFTRAPLSYLDYEDWNRRNTVFDSLDVSGGSGFLLKTAGGVEPVPAARVSAGFFQTLRIRPVIGQDFKPKDVTSGSRLLLITYPSWMRRFGGRPTVLGSTLNLSGETYTIIGVLPATFQFAPHGKAEFWTMIDPRNPCAVRRSCHNLLGIARLKDGLSVEQARTEMKVISNKLERQYPDSNRGQGASVLPLSEAIAGELRPILLLLLGGATLLLCIACVNVASLVLARSESRRREMALRSALGASSARLFTQFLIEGFVLVFASTLIAIVLSQWATKALEVLIPTDMLDYLPFLSGLSINSRVIAYALAQSSFAILIFSAIPALHCAASNMLSGLTEGSRGSATRGWRRLGSRLVVIELAMAMVLLVGAGLCAKSLNRLLHVELGFRPENLAAIEVAAPDTSYSVDRSIRLGRDIVRQVTSVPGVKSAAVSTLLPVSSNGNTDWIRFVGKPYDGKHIEVNERDVSSEYFRTIGATLLRGRYFDDSEDQSRPKVVIINQTLALRYFPGEDPIGKRIGDTSLSPNSLKTIVGVIKDVREGTLDSDIWPAEYHPFNQDPSNYVSVVARTSVRPERVLLSLGPAIRRLHPEVGTREESSMEALISNSMTAYVHRSAVWLVGAFAAMAFILGIVGLYSVVAYSVSQRTREIGVRIALGAQPFTVYKLVLRESSWLVAWGICSGAVLSVAAATAGRKMLFNVSSWDAPTLFAVAGLLGTSAILASFFPALHATKLSPVEALRAE